MQNSSRNSGSLAEPSKAEDARVKMDVHYIFGSVSHCMPIETLYALNDTKAELGTPRENQKHVWWQSGSAAPWQLCFFSLRAVTSRDQSGDISIVMQRTSRLRDHILQGFGLNCTFPLKPHGDRGR